MNLKNCLWLFTLFLISWPLLLTAETHNIYIDGAYNGEGGVMDKVMDDRLRESRKQMERIDPKSNNETVDSKDELLAALKKIKCKCGDELNLFFMGHGGRDGTFVFSQKKGKKLEIDELKKALREITKDCCCKINLVIFSCHSGSMVDPLFEEEHVRSVYASSLKKECSYTSGYFDDTGKFQDNGDWLKGFNEDLKAVPAGTSSAKAIAEATKSAREKMPIQFHEKQHPKAWVKDTLFVKGHVEDKIKTDKRKKKKYVEIVIYEPEHLRGQKKRIYFDGDNIPEKLKKCMWIQGEADFNNPDDPIDFIGPVTDTEKPVERILAHVKSRENNGKTLKVHTRKPNWLYCKEQKIKLKKGEKFDKRLTKCKWIEHDVIIHDPGKVDSVYDRVSPASPQFRIQFHISSINRNTGVVKGKILTPPWLGYKEIIIPKSELAKMGKVIKCQNIWLDMTIPPEGTPTGKNIRKVHMDKTKKYDADVAMNPAILPKYRTLSRTVMPTFTTTNIGKKPADYAVEVIIDEYISDLPENISNTQLKDIEDRFKPSNPLSENYRLATLCDHSKEGILYKDKQNFENIDAAESSEADYRPFIPEPGKLYKLCARVIFEADEVPANNHTQLLFFIPKQQFPPLPGMLEFHAEGTGRTTGEVVILTIRNKGDQTETYTIGPAIIPSTDKYQGYVIPDNYSISLFPGESTMMPLEGYCIKITSPPVPEAESVTHIENWIRPEDLGFIPTPPTSKDIDTPRETRDTQGVQITYPGAQIPFPDQIDIDKNIKEAAPMIFYATEELLETTNELIPSGKLETPISSDPDKLKQAMVQQSLWFYTAAIDPDEEDSYNFEDFRKNTINQIENNTGSSYEQFDRNTKEKVDTGVEDLFAGIVLVGEKAKIIKINPD